MLTSSNKFISADFINVAPYQGLGYLFDFITQFENACSWIENEFQLKIDGRIRDYKKVLNNYERKVRGRFGDDLYFFIHTVSEVNKIIKIHNYLKDQNSKNFKSTLYKSIYGNTYFFDTENAYKNDASRNFVFELSTASFYEQIGYKVDLSNNTDILIHEEKIAIECKKIHSKDQILTRVTEALKQINNLKKEKPEYDGVIHIDITNCFEIKFQKLISDKSQNLDKILLDVPNKEDMIRTIENHLENQRKSFIDEITPKIRKIIKDHNVLLIMHHDNNSFDISLINERVIIYECGYLIYNHEIIEESKNLTKLKNDMLNSYKIDTTDH